MQILQGSGNNGDFVHRTQPMNQTFKNVSDLFVGEDSWARKAGVVRTYNDMRTAIEEERNIRYNVTTHVANIRCVAKDNGLYLNIQNSDFDSIDFVPSEQVIKQLGQPQLCGIGATAISHLGGFKDSENEDDAENVADSQDKELAAAIINNSLRHVLQKKPDRNLLMRVRVPNHGQPSVRAILTEKFYSIDHAFMLDLMEDIVPGGICSHIRFLGHGDNIQWNTLIPDNIRVESDSEYGGMFACGNSEIGNSRVYGLPSVFRAICMNGCIWDQTVGAEFSKVHRGNVNLVELRNKMRTHLLSQIPLMNTGTERLLSLRGYGTDGISIRPIVTVLAKNAAVKTFSKLQARRIVEAYDIEDQPSAFGIVNAITRAAQLDRDNQEVFDRIGGTYLNFWTEPNRGRNRWDTLLRQAQEVLPTDVDKLLNIG